MMFAVFEVVFCSNVRLKAAPLLPCTETALAVIELKPVPMESCCQSVKCGSKMEQSGLLVDVETDDVQRGLEGTLVVALANDHAIDMPLATWGFPLLSVPVT